MKLIDPSTSAAVGKIGTTRFPYRDEVIHPPWGRALCRHYGLRAEAERIRRNPDRFKPWPFQAHMILPLELHSLLSGIGSNVLSVLFLQFALRYAYGILPVANGYRAYKDKLEADHALRSGLLLMAGLEPWKADSIYAAIRAGAASISWAFARSREAAE